MARLTSDQFKRLQAALLAGFSPGELKQMVRIELGENLAAIVADGALSHVLFELIGWAERHDQVTALIRGTRQVRPHDAALAALAAEIAGEASAPETSDRPQPAPPGGWSIGKIEATNVSFGDQTIIDTGGGAYIGGAVHVGGSFSGRDSIGQEGGESPALRRAQTKLAASIARCAPAAVLEDVTERIDAMNQALAAGDDERAAAAITELVALAPDAKMLLVAALSEPPLGDLIGPTTRSVVQRLA